jgi:hypothetical protein
VAVDPAAAPGQPTDSRHDGRRVVVAWLVLSAIATPLVAIYVGPHIPPGNASVQGEGQTFDNQVMTAFVTPVLCLMAVFFGYGLIRFKARRSEAILDGPPIRDDAQIRLLWIVITTAMVLFLAGFGTYELLKDGAGGGRARTRSHSPPATERLPGAGGRTAVAIHLPLPVARRHGIELAPSAGRHARRAPHHVARRRPHPSGPSSSV